MNLKQALEYARDTLSVKNIEDAALESEVLLMHLLKIDRVRLYTDMENELTPEQEQAFHEIIKRRLDGEPSAYITGNREFYGLDFQSQITLQTAPGLTVRRIFIHILYHLAETLQSFFRQNTCFLAAVHSSKIFPRPQTFPGLKGRSKLFINISVAFEISIESDCGLSPGCDRLDHR